MQSDANGCFSELKTYAFRMHADDGDDDPGSELLKLVWEYEAKHRVGFQEALASVTLTPEGRKLVDRYNLQSRSPAAQARSALDRQLRIGDPQGVVALNSGRADIRAHNRAVALLAEGKAKDYGSAVRAALDADPTLVAAHGALCKGRRSS